MAGLPNPLVEDDVFGTYATGREASDPLQYRAPICGVDPRQQLDVTAFSRPFSAVVGPGGEDGAAEAAADDLLLEG